LPVALLIPALQLLNPMPGVITQGVHEGYLAIDIACFVGTPVRAAHDGQGSVRRSYTHSITFVLRGDNGLQTSYSHLNSAAAAGLIKRGDPIGTCGNTGVWSSGPHLHFESNHLELLGSLIREEPTVLTGMPQPHPAGGIGGSPEALKANP
jgi:murein DD-endopeptidase MepM/ murein hydrolase activator NlpD